MRVRPMQMEASYVVGLCVCVAFATNILRNVLLVFTKLILQCGVALIISVLATFFAAMPLLTCGIVKGHMMTAPHLCAS